MKYNLRLTEYENRTSSTSVQLAKAGNETRDKTLISGENQERKPQKRGPMLLENVCDI